MKRKIILSHLGLLLVCSTFAQIKGKVVEKINESNTPVFGATIHWLNTNLATTTDTSGLFTLPTTDKSKELVISYIGYSSDTLEITDTTKFITLQLKSGINLNEVEVSYTSTGSELSYMSALKTETLNERSLMKAACCNLSESFETNPSVDVNFSDAVTGAKQIQMLGLSGQYAQITKENMPYLRGLANGYGLSFIPGTWIQSIQLSKGAGSVVNGYESFTGQINTELQNPETSHKINFNAYVNENLRNEYNLNLKHRFNEKFSIGLLNHYNNNPLAQDMNGDGFLDIPTGKQYNVMNKYSFNSQKGFEAQFGGGYLQDERQGGQMKNLNDSLYQINIQNKKWELYSKTGFVFKKRASTSMGLQLSYLNHEQENRYGNETYNGLQKTFYANYIFQSFINNTNHNYKVGASFMNDEVNENYRTFLFNRNEQVAGVFGEYAFNYKSRFNLVAGLRADYHNYYGLFYTPRLHLRYALNENKSVFRLSGGRALKTANIFSENNSLMASSRQWNIEQNNTIMPYGLRPETGWNYGFNFTQKLNLNYREAYVTVDLYRTDFTGQVVVDVDNNTQAISFYNLNGKSFSNTAQIEFGWEIRKRLNIKTAYRLVDNQVTYKTGLLQKALISKHRAFINIAYETKNKHWQFDATLQYNGRKRLPNTNSNPTNYQRAEYSPDFYNVLGQITYLTKVKQANIHFYVGVENALGYKQQNPIVASDVPFSKYFDASMVWGPIYGRMLYGGLRFFIK